jgi:flagellar assembly protein FliH
MSEAAPAAVWELPQINGPVVARTRRAADLDALEREAWDSGHAEGREAGLLAARQEQQAALNELQARVEHLDAIIEFMAKPIADLDQQVQRQLAVLAGAIARQVARRELKINAEEIVGVVRETLSLLPLTAREVRVHLNPEDAKLVRARLPEVTSERAWSIVEDPVLSRGGCRVSSEDSTIDAQLEQRLGAAIAAVLGDARNPHDAEAAP